MDKDEKIANVLLLMGPESVPIYDQFVFNEEQEAQKKTLTNVLRYFDAHFEPVKNIIYERVKFNSLVQGDLSIHKFITTIQSQADVCEYGTMREELIRDRIIVGVSDNRLREYLIDLENNDLQKCISKAKQYVSHHEQSAKMSRQTEVNLDMIGKGKSEYQPRGQQQQQRKHQRETAKCFYCPRRNHKAEFCPAHKSVCRKCKQKEHWANSQACRGKQGKQRAAHEVEDIDVDGLYLGSESD
ncbi:uncharacterized protein [Watersipora subatra]|uniref:uncharacterized protein n=1 Tax=Watersipora subatra TaxID=2589382 RepID=UPI00355B9E29